MATQPTTKPQSFEEYCRTTFDPKKEFSKPEVLKGVRVLSCTQYILGPSAAAYLGELGAEVIKIEAVRRGEAMRHTTPFNEPFLYPLAKWVPERGTGLGFVGANTNEYFTSIDFHRPEGQDLVKKLAAKSDVFVENYRPGTFDRWGIGYRQLKEINPRLIYCWHGITRERWGNWDTQLCVHGIIKCGKSSYPNSENPQEQEEGYILISAFEDKDFARLCKAIGDTTLATKYAKKDIRIKPESQMEIYPVLEKWAADKTKEQVAAIMDTNNIINQPVWNAKEVANHPHWNERGAVRWLDDPTYGELLHQAPAFKMSATPARLKWALKPVGADNERIFSELAGLTPADIKRLEDQETI